MIVYKYDLFQDIKVILHNRRQAVWLKEKNLVVFPFNIFRSLKIIFRWFLFRRPVRPVIDFHEDVFCYWVTAGTWGAYELPNKIFICPENLTPEKLEDTIKHEIIHIFSEDEIRARGMSHEEKESLVNSRKL
ncbi:MAG: hypothetical protein Q8L36_01735 [bacterium]|nr:hypothetical protein [bacterium]